MLFFLYFYRNVFQYVCEQSPVPQEDRLLQNVSNKKIFQNSVLPLNICINTGSVCSLLSCPFSNSHMTYCKYKYINHKNYDYMSYKCEAIDMNSIQYYLIHIIITHDSNMYFYIEMYMIIITIIINICIMHKILEHVPLYPYCKICLYKLHVNLFQDSSL